MMSDKFENTLNDLSENPMFRLSLGSKELFHSNFLAFLWDCNKQAFLNMLNDLLPEGEKINEWFFKKEELLTLCREKDNLDISIRHTENKKEIIDIVIENKVKSIPYKEQLQKYKDKVTDHQNDRPATYILLTLVNEFPNQKAIEAGKWNIITYAKLAESIDKYYSDDKIDDKLQQYVTDYIKFINLLGNLNILEDFLYTQFHNPDTIKEFHEIKLSDLYLKQRGSYFICLLYARLTKALEKIDIKLGERSQASGKNVTETPNNTTIYLASGMNRGKSTITIHIYPKAAESSKKSQSSYALQIEGNQYRHMFIQNQLVIRRSKEIENLLNTMPLFDTNRLSEKIQPEKQCNKQELKDFTEKFNQYQPDCLYKYVTFEETTGGQMLDIVVEDVKKVLGYLDECKEIAKEIQKIT